MREQIKPGLRIAGLILLALVLWQVIQAGFEANPLAKATIPPLPTLTTNTPATNAPPVNPAGGVAAAPGATNLSPALGTNLPPGTNRPMVSSLAKLPVAGSNGMVAVLSTSLSTNVAALTATNGGGSGLVATQTMLAAGMNPSAGGTPGPGANPAGSPGKKHKKRSMGPGMGMPGMMGGMGGPPQLPPEIQARVDKIVNSEIFAPVFHPLPMALMGIAGDTVFLRTASGQTGLIKAGDSLGEVKLLRIGINRVLVETGGQQTELTIFDGYGGDSLLSTTNGSSK